MMIECPKCSSDDITTLDYVTVYAEIDVNEGELIEVLSNDKPESKEYFCKSCSNEWEGE